MRPSRLMLLGPLVLLAGLLAVPGVANAAGSPPVALNDRYRTTVDEELSPRRSVLRNDTDPEGDPLTAVLQSPPSAGALVLRSDGRFTYTPDPGFEGSVFFSYTATDGTGTSNNAYVILDVNGPPTAVDDTYVALTGQRLDVPAPGVLTNDIDLSPGRQRARLVSGPHHGRGTIAQTGALSYRPQPGFEGSDTMTYVLSDGQFTSEVTTVTLSVRAGNSAPVAVTETYILGEDGYLEEFAPGLLTNDIDADGDPLIAEVVQYPFSGNLYVDPSGAFTYEPYPDFDSDVTFTYRVYDGLDWSDPVEVLIDMFAINDPPIAEDDYYSTSQDTVLEVGSPGLLGNDSDPVEGDGLTAAISSNPLNGEVVVNGDGSFSYTPDPGFFGYDNFSYMACDPGGCATGNASIEVYENV
jgi:large repetitive protein